MAQKDYTFKSALAKRRIDKIREVLTDSAMTSKALAAQIFLSPKHTRSYLNYLHRKNRVYIKVYRRNLDDPFMRYQPEYAWGKGVDAQRPSISAAERSRLRRMNPAYREWERAARLQRRQANDNVLREAA